MTSYDFYDGARYNATRRGHAFRTVMTRGPWTGFRGVYARKRSMGTIHDLNFGGLERGVNTRVLAVLEGIGSGNPLAFMCIEVEPYPHLFAPLRHCPGW